MQRDEFVAAMIAELARQKTKAGGTAGGGGGDIFFTGAELTATDVYRKMCFDFPIVDNHMLEIFLNGLKRWGTERDSFRAAFTLNDKMLYNLMTMHESGATGEEDRANTNRRQELACCISAELFLGLPVHLLILPFGELTQLLALSSTGSVLRSEVLDSVRSFLCNISLSQVTTSLPGQYLVDGGHLAKALRVLDKLMALYQALSGAEELQRRRDETPADLLSLLEFVYGPMNPESLADEREHRIQWLKDVVSHLSALIVELLCAFPELLPSVFAAFCAVHIGRGKVATDPFGAERPLPSLGHYLLLLALSRLSAAFNRKDRPAAVAPTIKAAVDAVRGQMAKSGLLTDLVEICAQIKRHNLPATLTAPRVDLESAGFLVDLTLLMLPEERAPGLSAAFSASALAEVCITSRLLPHLLDAEAAAALTFLHSAPEDAESQKHDALYWALSVRLTFALVRLFMWDVKLTAFALAHPGLGAVWPQLLAGTGDESCAAALCSRGGAWRAALGATAASAMVLRQAASAAEHPQLLVAIVSVLQMTVREVNSVDAVIERLRDRDGRDESAVPSTANRSEADQLTGDPTSADSSAAVAPPLVADRSSGQLIAGYLRGLEAIDVCCRALTREDLPAMLSAMRRGGVMAAFLQTFLQSWVAVAKALGASKAKLSTDAGDGQQILLGAFERSVRSCKGLVSLLEGGATSKSD